MNPLSRLLTELGRRRIDLTPREFAETLFLANRIPDSINLINQPKYKGPTALHDAPHPVPSTPNIIDKPVNDDRPSASPLHEEDNEAPERRLPFIDDGERAQSRAIPIEVPK